MATNSLADSLPQFTVSQTIAVFNQMFETATPLISVVGEVANYKVNQGKWVFFDIKDEVGSLNCFMPLYQLRMAIQDGMKVVITARPNVTKWGKLSLTVQAVAPVGEGSIKKSFELLKKKLAAEGLFDEARKRQLPELPHCIGVISSVDAAGYRDFIKIISERQGGLIIDVISTQVQGAYAADQIIAAIHQFNEMANSPEVIAILRGGGSRDDLVAFDDEQLVRTVAASRIPIISGVGHEIDTTLIDLAADVRASTPSNAAEILVIDKRELIATTDDRLRRMVGSLELRLASQNNALSVNLNQLAALISDQQQQLQSQLQLRRQALLAYDPRAVLRRGYALLWQGRHLVRDAIIGDKITAETTDKLIDMEVTNVRNKN
ncbi:MAG: exodeoxyribonuclease VII large subunit [Candidatus Saccharibacteria bacterium]|nr:exodeoxyribonuclease VII large subunit [Candidatus Saccharibacteria bacterium]